MNPSFKFILVFIISLEVSIKQSIATNGIIIVAALIYLVGHRVKWHHLLMLILVPFIGALTIFSTLYWFATSPNLYNAFSLASRVYVYTLTIACVTATTSQTSLARSFEQNLHLPSKFAYGVLAALNIVPYMKQAVNQIRVAGMMRGVYLSFWSPMLYFKAILVALNSAENLAQGMESHGYEEDQKRSVIVAISVSRKDWLITISSVILLNFCLFTLK